MYSSEIKHMGNKSSVAYKLPVLYSHFDGLLDAAEIIVYHLPVLLLKNIEY